VLIRIAIFLLTDGFNTGSADGLPTQSPCLSADYRCGPGSVKDHKVNDRMSGSPSGHEDREHRHAHADVRQAGTALQRRLAPLPLRQPARAGAALRIEAATGI